MPVVGQLPAGPLLRLTLHPSLHSVAAAAAMRVRTGLCTRMTIVAPQSCCRQCTVPLLLLLLLLLLMMMITTMVSGMIVTPVKWKRRAMHHTACR
jgi:hypothetical protein